MYHKQCLPTKRDSKHDESTTMTKPETDIPPKVGIILPVKAGSSNLFRRHVYV